MSEANTLMGFVIFVEEMERRSFTALHKAAAKAGIDESFLKDLHPRHVFTRAMDMLRKSAEVHGKFRDKTADNEAHLEFSFISKKAKYEYEATCTVRWSKIDGEIEVVRAPHLIDPADVKAEALAMVEKAKGTAKPSDINSLVARFLARSCRRVMLRAGVYFVPYAAAEKVDAVKRFFSELQISFFCNPVSSHDGDATAYQKAIVADMKQRMQALTEEIKTLKETGKLTQKTGSNRLTKLKAMLQEYRDLAEATRTDMNSLLKEAGDDATLLQDGSENASTLIAAVRSGGKVNPLVVDLMIAAEMEDAEELRMAARPAMPEDIQITEVEVEQPSLPFSGRGMVE